MSKVEQLFDLYNKREQAKKANFLNDSAERLKYMQQFRTVFMPEGHEKDPATTEVIQDIQRASKQMWNKFAELDAPRAEIQAEIDKLIVCHKPVANAVSIDDDGWSVHIYDKEEDFSAWVDVWIDTDHKDVVTDWNQDIFYTNDEYEVFKMLHQENADVYELFTSIAIDVLVERGYIRQNIDGEWENAK